MNEIIVDNLKRQINEDHNLIQLGTKKLLKIAIRIGDSLLQAKSYLKHGDVNQWINDNCLFSERTAYNYIKLAEYKNKIATVANLQEAYKQIEYFESQKKKEQKKKEEKKYKEYKKTGTKPDDWNRHDDYQCKKYYDDNERTERIEQFKKEKQSNKNDDNGKNSFEYMQGLLNELGKDIKKFENLKEGISGNEDVLAIIEVKLNQLSDDKRRLEFCNTIIKYLREKAIQYQKMSVT